MQGVKKYKLSKREAFEVWAKDYPKVLVWLGKLQRKEESAWYLWLYCDTVGKTPDELLTLKDDPKSREAEYLLDKFVADEEVDIPHVTKVGISIAVKSFFAHNYRELAKKSGQIAFEKKKPYRKHSKEELLKIYRATMNPRDRALITFVWSTGIARESLTKIQWKHLETDWEKQETPCIVLPDKLIKGHGIGKYKGVQQITFLTPEAKKDLLDYREFMEKLNGVKWTLEHNVWLRVNAPYTPLKYDAFSLIADDLGKRSGIEFSWHDARRYVETALEEIRINPNWARKIRGRKVRGEEAPYSRPAIEQLREKYKEAVSLLQFTVEADLSELKRRQEALERIQAKIVTGEDLDTEDKKDIQRYHLLRLGMKTKARRFKDKSDGAGASILEEFEQIHEAELLKYLRDGWSLVHKLANGEVIVKR